MKKFVCLLLSMILFSSVLMVTVNGYVAFGEPTISSEITSTVISEESHKVSGKGWTVQKGNPEGVEKGSVTFDIPSTVWSAGQKYLSLEVYVDMDVVPCVDGSNSKYTYFDVEVKKDGVSADETSLRLAAHYGCCNNYGIPSYSGKTWIPVFLDLGKYNADTCDSVTIYYFNNSLLENVEKNQADGDVYFRNVKMVSAVENRITPVNHSMEIGVIANAQGTLTFERTNAFDRDCWKYTFEANSRLLVEGVDLIPSRYNYLLIEYYCEDENLADGINQFQIKCYDSKLGWGTFTYLKTYDKIQTGGWKTAVMEIPNQDAADQFYLQINVPGEAKNIMASTLYVSAIVLTTAKPVEETPTDPTPTDPTPTDPTPTDPAQQEQTTDTLEKKTFSQGEKETEPETQTNIEQNKKGCSSSASMNCIFVIVAIAGVALALKSKKRMCKKENEK